MYFSIRLLHSSCDLPGRPSTQSTPEASGPSVCGHPQVPHEEQPLQRCYTHSGVGLATRSPEGEEGTNRRRSTTPLRHPIGKGEGRAARQDSPKERRAQGHKDMYILPSIGSCFEAFQTKSMYYIMRFHVSTTTVIT